MKKISIIVLSVLFCIFFISPELTAKKNSKKNNIKQQAVEEEAESGKKDKEQFKKKFRKYFIKNKSLSYKNSFLKVIEIETIDDKVECWYSGEKFEPENNSFTKTYNKSDYFNCEHVWPQSKFGKAKAAGAKHDMHHLIPTEQKMNTMRSSWPYGEATTRRDISDLKNNVFEVRDKFKGNIARAIFYFSVMYNCPIEDNEEKVLREWNKIDPADKFDKMRNDGIENAQGNRNIFSDHPEYVDLIEDF